METTLQLLDMDHLKEFVQETCVSDHYSPQGISTYWKDIAVSKVIKN